MAETVASLDYPSLLELAENFSDDGVINFNFLRTLLVNIVEILKKLDESKLNWKMLSTKELININHESTCGDVLPLTEINQKSNRVKTMATQTSMMQSSAECQCNVSVKSQAVLINPTTKTTATQLSYEADRKINKPTNSSEKPTQCHLLESVHDSSSRILIPMDHVMFNKIEHRFDKLENDIREIANATNEIVNEIDIIESTLEKDASEIKHVRYSLERLRVELHENISPEIFYEMAPKIDAQASATSAQISSMILCDKEKGRTCS